MTHNSRMRQRHSIVAPQRISIAAPFHWFKLALVRTYSTSPKTLPSGPPSDRRCSGPDAEALFDWNSEKFGRLLSYHNESSDAGGGYPVDTLFSSFIFVGYSWYDDKKFWPGQGRSMNKTDWLAFLEIQLTVGVCANLPSSVAHPCQRSHVTSLFLAPFARSISLADTVTPCCYVI
jgi:hypothetical protein